jgi:four helix bundle protein
MSGEKKFDLEERTTKFAEAVITLVKKLPNTAVNQRIVSQVVGSSGSIGANYGEAVEAESKKDFIHKISIAKKEAKETEHWLRLLAAVHPEHLSTIVVLQKECRELLLILAKIVRTSRASIDN